MHDFPIARAAASQLIKKFHIRKPSQIDIEAISFIRGALLIERPLDGAAARLVRRGETGVISVNSNIRERGRRRFAAAHDLGHFELHKKMTQINLCSDEVFLKWHKSDKEEAEANVFAAELLMPKELISPYCREENMGFDGIKNIAQIFNTTITATAIRFVNYAPTPCCLIASQEGLIRWFKASDDFPYYVRGVNNTIHELSCAYDFFSGNEPSVKPELVIGEAWVEDLGPNQNIYFYEQVFTNPTYQSALSLIWLNE